MCNPPDVASPVATGDDYGRPGQGEALARGPTSGSMRTVLAAPTSNTPSLSPETAPSSSLLFHGLRALLLFDDEVVHALLAVHLDGERRADTEHGVAVEPG